MLAAILIGAIGQKPLSPYDRRIEYIGRFDQRDSKGPKGAWSNVEARLVIHGSGVFVTVSDTGPDFLQVVVDGLPTRSVPLQPGIQTMEVQAPTVGLHTYEFVKRTEAQVGTIQFLQFDPEGKLLQAHREKRLIQVIGDSISCGYGDEATSPDDHFSPETENSYLTYEALAARRCRAEIETISWSGRKIWPDNTMPSIYDLNVPTDTSSTYDFKGEDPEVIVVNLGTNDFARDNPDEAQWTDAYKAFLERLRFHYPDATFYVAFGSMTSDAFPPGHNALSHLRDYATRVVESMRAEGDHRVHLLEFEEQKQEDGYGADGHPSLKTHEKMSIKLELALRKDLRWQ